MSRPLLIHTEASHGWGGQEMRTLAESRWFRDQGYDVEFIARPDATLTEAASKEGFTVHERLLSKKSQLGDLAFCRRLFKDRKPLMVGTHSNIDSRVCLAAAALAGVPNRFRYRHVSIPVKPSPWNHLIYRKFATRIITTAESIARPLRENFKLQADKAISIPTGVRVPDDIPVREDARLELCHQLDLPDRTRFIGQVSVLRRWKGHYDVMAAFDKIHEEIPDYHLVFAGGGPGTEEMPKRARDYSCARKIHFLGHLENPWPVFRALDIATLASTEGEGVPQSGMQALLSGCAFVGTKVGGIPEIIEDNSSGLLVPHSSPDELAVALKRLALEPGTREKFANKGREWAEANTTLDQMGHRITALMNE